MSNKKRIVFTVTNDLTYDQRMQKVCRSLVNAGYEVELVGRNKKASVPLSNEPFEQTRHSCFFQKGKLFYMEYNLRLLFYLTFNRFDAVCAIDLDTIIPAYIIGKLKGAKLVYDAHEYFTEVPEVVRRPSVQKIWQWVEREFVPKFNLVYTVSASLAKLFADKYGKQFEVIRNVSVYNAMVVAGARPDGKYILYQGALNEGRGLEQLIEAMQDVNMKLKLAGEGDLSDVLRELAQHKGLQHRVEFLGYVTPAELSAITRDAFIGINLLENRGLSYFYSLSNKFFDYIHAGIPQLCIAFPEYKLLNEKYRVALLTETCEPDEIKNALQRMIQDKDLYSALQKNCEVCSREINWQEEEKKLTTLYGQLLG